MMRPRRLLGLALALGAVALVPAAATGDAVSAAPRTNLGLVWGGGGGVYGSDTSGRAKRLITAFPRLRDKYGWDGYGDPTWSRTGRRLAYRTYASGGSHIHVFTKATRKGVTIATPTAWAQDAAWAPDEDRLAVYNFPDNSRSGGYISIVSLSSGRSRVLIAPQLLRRDQQPAWSPDGKTIAFVRDRLPPDERQAWPPAEIHLVDAAGRSVRRLTVGRSPDWSPDGKRIVFVGNDGIYVIAPNGRGRTRLVRAPVARAGHYESLNPKWSPDGRTILYVVAGEDAETVWTMDAEGGHRTPIYGTGTDLDWDPDWH